MPHSRLPLSVTNHSLLLGCLPQAITSWSMPHGRMPLAITNQSMPQGRLPLSVLKKPEYAAWMLATFLVSLSTPIFGADIELQPPPEGRKNSRTHLHTIER